MSGNSPTEKERYTSVDDGCILESLSLDLLIPIISACSSLGDLGALIRASPVAYRVFLSKKTFFLLQVIINEIGPGTRDAIILAETPTAFKGSPDFDARVDDKVRDYRRRLEAGAPSWGTAGLGLDAAIALAKVTRDITYFVDLYIRFRLEYFRQHLEPPQQHAEPATVERHRIAQALLRYQLLVHMHGGRYWEPRDYPLFVTRVFSLFSSWELEQVSQMDHFIGSLVRPLVSCEEPERDPYGAPFPAWGSQYYMDHYYPDLAAFRVKLRDATRQSPSILESMGRESNMTDARITGACSWFDWLKASHRITPPPRPTDDASTVFIGDETASDPPWAWCDALMGQKTCRWGLDLAKRPGDDMDDQEEYRRVIKVLQAWRFLGMVFWNRGRAERLRQAKVLESCTSGWLAPWQDV